MDSLKAFEFYLNTALDTCLHIQTRHPDICVRVNYEVEMKVARLEASLVLYVTDGEREVRRERTSTWLAFAEQVVLKAAGHDDVAEAFGDLVRAKGGALLEGGPQAETQGASTHGALEALVEAVDQHRCDVWADNGPYAADGIYGGDAALYAEAEKARASFTGAADVKR